MTRRRGPSVRPLVLVAVAVALGAAGCHDSPVGGDDDGRSARVGETFVAQLSQEIEGFPTSIVVPGRRYDLVVTSPREELDTVTASEEGIDPDAADGTRFVAVTWDLSAAGGDALVLSGDGPEPSPVLSIVVDGEAAEVGPLDEEGVFARWVVVPEEVDDVGVAVEYDGVTQTVEDVSDRLAGDPVGGSELLYADTPPGLHDPECPAPTEDAAQPARYVIGGCHVQISDPFPYHRQQGWAPDGRAWVVARTMVDPVVVGWDEPGPDGAVVDYEVAPEDVAVTLDGAGPVDVLPSEPDQPAGLQDDGSWSGEAVFAVSADVTDVEVAFTRPYTGLPEDPAEAAAEGTPAELAGTYEASFPVEVG